MQGEPVAARGVQLLVTGSHVDVVRHPVGAAAHEAPLAMRAAHWVLPLTVAQ